MSRPAAFASVGVAACLSVAALGQGRLVFGNPETFCRNGAFPGGGVYEGDRPVFKTAVLVGPSDARIHFLGDLGECPRAGDPSCVERSYLVPGDRVVVSKTYQSWACSWYQPARGAETVGWLPAASLAIADPASPAVDAWMGVWKYDDDSLRITRGRGASDLRVRGEAYWPGLHTSYPSVNTGSVDVVATPVRNTLTLEDGGCKAWLSLVGGRLVANDNHECGGMNVTFDGVYRK